MKIQCIALDMDRTTLNAQGKLSEGNRKALSAAIEKGIHIVIASGRAFSTLPKDVLSVPGIEYAITSNGAAIYRISDGTCLHQYKLTPSSVHTILTAVQNEFIAFEAFIDGTAYAQTSYVEDPVFYGVDAKAIPYIQRTRKKINHMEQFISDHAHCLDSLDIVVNNHRKKQEIWSKLDQISNDIYITSSVSQLIEISHKNAGKHSGLRFLQNYLNLSPYQTAAFGDGDNDVDMLLVAGTGIAMENASQACRNASDAITRHHDKDGVAWGMEHILHLFDS